MKLLIDIPDGFYKELMSGSDIEISCDGYFSVTDSWASDVMRNGKPFDNVLDEIKAEIKTNKEKWWYGVNDDCFMKLSDVLAIIDKYRAESEKL